MVRLVAEVCAEAACAKGPAATGPAPTGHREQGSSIRPVIVRDAAAAFELVAADPTLRVDIFESDWAELDRDRDRAAQLGLAARINFHHRAAYQCPFVRFLLSRSRTRVVMIDRAAA